ncbi:MAG: lysophospholipid acyltransferase family protein [Turneriella sp.]
MAKFPWEDQFMASVESFVAAGMPAHEAASLLKEYIRLSHLTKLPAILDFEHHPELLDGSPLLEPDTDIHALMHAIFVPLLSRFTLEGKENFSRVIPALKGTGVTIVSNHLSLFDATVTQMLLGREADFTKYAEQFFFITGRLVFTSDFTRVAGRAFRTMLVASPRDMADNESIRRELMRLNLRSFKEAKERQRNGEALVLYPEGTRSRNNTMLPFHGPLFSYLDGTVVLPVAVEGPEKILHAESFMFGFTEGAMRIGEPVFIGAASDAPAGIPALDASQFPKDTRKQETMDAIGRMVAALLPAHMRGAYA